MEKKIVISKGTIKGKFKGFKNSHTVFELSSGQIWRQNEAKFMNYFSVNPEVEIISKDGKNYLEISAHGVLEAVEVIRIK
ncbi:MAG: hypothetical protein JW943_03845 [Deltaproteobacteria bacterium]|nr:hypothetical protein [Deltaproteobacteria bacterium]